jgi:antitoxin MazE
VITTVQKWGNSQGLRLSREILQAARIELGDKVEVMLRDDVIVITPVRRRRGSHTLKDLIARIPEGYRADEVAWGPIAGEEEW